MFVKGLRKFLYAGALLALAPFTANAADEPKKVEAVPAPAAPLPTTPCAPTTVKVKVCEWVNEPCEYTRTVYKPVTTNQTYTAYRCETVNETCTKQVTCYKKVCETVMQTRCVTKKVPCWEEKTVMVSKMKCVQVTEMVQKTHYNAHWVCCEVPSSPGFFSHLASKCSDPCNPCACAAPCTKTVRKLQVDKCTQCVPVCRTKMVRECVPVCKKVCTYKSVTETCQVPVTKVRCVPECKTVTYNVCKKVSVPYQATRCVTTCQPCTEVVKGTKRVAHWVEKDVAVAPCDPCASACCGSSLFGGLRARLTSFGGHNSCCSSGCGSACGVAATCGSSCGGCK